MTQRIVLQDSIHDFQLCGARNLWPTLADMVRQKNHSNKISKVQFGIKLCHTDPRLFCSFSTLNPRADIDRWDFHSVRLHSENPLGTP